MSNQRLQKLVEMLQKQPRDPFLLYGIAMEHKKSGNDSAAVEFLDQCIQADPAYCYAYYQKAQICARAGQKDVAREIYLRGIEQAKAKGDAHARTELEAALALLI